MSMLQYVYYVSNISLSCMLILLWNNNNNKMNPTNSMLSDNVNTPKDIAHRFW